MSYVISMRMSVLTYVVQRDRSYYYLFYFFFFNDTATTEIYTLSLHDALPIWGGSDISYRVLGDIVIEPNSQITDKDLQELLKNNC